MKYVPNYIFENWTGISVHDYSPMMSSVQTNLDEEAIKQLMDMGFDRNQSIAALGKSGNNVDQACSILLGE